MQRALYYYGPVSCQPCLSVSRGPRAPLEREYVENFQIVTLPSAILELLKKAYHRREGPQCKEQNVMCE